MKEEEAVEASEEDATKEELKSPDKFRWWNGSNE
jgi:hypothetical protein